MRFPTYFKRGKNTPAAGPAIGSDTAPTFGSGHVTSTTPGSNRDNIMASRIAGVGNPIARLAVGYWYEGGGVAVTLPVTAWVWDANSAQWYQAASGTLTNGQITYLKIPVLADPPPTQANIGAPGAGGVEVLIVVADNTSPDGTLHFVAGPDTAEGQ